MKAGTSMRASALLRKASGGCEPTRADREKTRAAIARRLAVGVAAGAAISAGVKSAAAAPSIAPAAGVAVGAGTVGAGAAGAGATVVGTSAGVGVSVASAASVGLATKIVAAIAIFGTVSAGAVGVERLRSSPAPKNAPVALVASPAEVSTSASSPLTLTQPLGPASAAVDPAVQPPLSVAVEPVGEATPSVGATAAVETTPTSVNSPEKQAVRVTPAKPQASVAVAAPVAAAVSSLQTGAEVALLEQAQHALAAKQGERALALLDEHARTYPNGALAEERDAARVLALCETGRDDEAHAVADAFIVAHPRSPLAARVRAACPASK